MSKHLILLAFTLIAGFSFGQPPGGGPEGREDKIKSHKIAFISMELNLSTEEAEKFWPVYNEYEAEVEEVRKERKGYLDELRDIDNISDDRAYELTQLLFKTDQKENEIRLKYLDKFANVVGKKKAAKVFMAEEKFKRELLKKLRKHGPPGEKHGGPPPRH